MADAVRFSRRNLPHFRMDHAVYFVTWRGHPAQAELSEKERSDVVAALRCFDGVRYRLHGYVVMNDHVHVLVEPVDAWELYKILHSWKSFTANKFQRFYRRQGHLWQDESFDRIIRDDAEYREKRAYILDNPWRRWPGLASYPWVWVIGEQ